jgi:hypothetical protein
MINEQLALSSDTIITCSKFKALECLTFISYLIKNLPDNERDYAFSRVGAEYLIMNIMDTGIDVKINKSLKENYQKCIDNDYFGVLLKKVFINAPINIQNKIRDDLLKLYTYNGTSINEITANQILNTPQKLFTAMLHSIRYNYNDFFIIGER